MKIAMALTLAVALAACSQGQGGKDRTADDFAARIGEGGTTATPVTTETTAAAAPVPQGANALQLQTLGDISAVNLGPRDGGCTFQSQNSEMLISGAPNDRAIPGKAAVRVGGKLLLLDANAGGLDALYNGPTFTGQGLTVTVAPAKVNRVQKPANMTITTDDGRRRVVSGVWVCG